MKKLAVIFLTALTLYAFTSDGLAKSKGGQVRVKGHTTKKGTYVQPHNRTAPDKTKQNNWDSKGNINPYTGKEGTKDPLKLEK